MTTQLYDHEFSPWRIDGDRRIVASEDAWRRVRAFARKNGAARVRVPVDVFEDWKGPMVDAAGEEVGNYENDGPLEMSDVRRRLFALIDEYPNVTWMLETERPENVMAMWPKYDNDYRPGPDNVRMAFGNLWLYAKVNTQAKADTRIPHLLDVPAAVRGLVMTPREEINLTECAPYILGGNESNPGVINAFNAMCYHPATCMFAPDVRGTKDGINHVIIRGGAEPMHPDWVRSIIRQCEAAGVPVWFDGWGEWLPWRSECMNESHLSFAGFPMKRFSKKSGFVTESRNFDSAAEKDRFLFDECVNMARVGVAHSGRVIDGRTVNQLPEVSNER